MSSRIEDNIQISCVTWFRLQYRQHIIMSFPAGFALRGDAIQRARTGKRMKDMGYTVGTPDIFIPVPNKDYNGLFIELKAGKNKATDKQKEVIEQLKNNGYQCEIIYSFDEFRKLINEYLKQ